MMGARTVYLKERGTDFLEGAVQRLVVADRHPAQRLQRCADPLIKIRQNNGNFQFCSLFRLQPLLIYSGKGYEGFMSSMFPRQYFHPS